LEKNYSESLNAQDGGNRIGKEYKLKKNIDLSLVLALQCLPLLLKP
jgi:hypothetical protein